MYFQAEAELYFSKKLWFLFACRKEALESALPKFHSIKRTDGFPNIWQFSQELYNKLWRALHVFSKPSVPLTLHSRSFQQAPNPLLHVWILSFPFCHFLWYFYKNLHRQQQLCEISVLCNFSAFFPQWSSLFFSVLYNIPAQGIWVVPSLEWTVNFKKGKFICWKLFFSQLWKESDHACAYCILEFILRLHGRLRLAWRVSSCESTWTEKFKVNQKYKLAQNQKRNNWVSSLRPSVHLHLHLLINARSYKKHWAFVICERLPFKFLYANISILTLPGFLFSS